MTAAVNGRVLSCGNAASMHWPGPSSRPRSRGRTLRPGDVLGSGTVGHGCILELTPEATGAAQARRRLWSWTIERLGTLRNRW